MYIAFTKVVFIVVFLFGATASADVDQQGSLTSNSTQTEGTEVEYSAARAVEWAKAQSRYPGERMDCSYFAAQALKAGGLFADPEVTDFTNYEGYDLTDLEGLRSILVNKYDFSSSKKGNFCGIAGQILIYKNDRDILFNIGSATALELSKMSICVIDAHNPLRCGRRAEPENKILFYMPKRNLIYV
jgi:hypothetical protein